jgi:hypothetical protein
MTLADLRKLSIKKNLRIRFVLPNQMECVITQNGIAQIPALRSTPDFNIEQELASVTEFLLEPVVAPTKKNAPKPRSVGREELATMTSAAGAVVAHDDHDDE